MSFTGAFNGHALESYQMKCDFFLQTVLYSLSEKGSEKALFFSMAFLLDQLFNIGVGQFHIASLIHIIKIVRKWFVFFFKLTHKLANVLTGVLRLFSNASKGKLSTIISMLFVVHSISKFTFNQFNPFA